MRVRALLVASLLLAGTSALQARSLYWSAVDVDAQIDRDGSLTVEETQHYVFDGEWNGGERTFDIRYLQSLDLLGVDRIEGSSVIPLAKGDLASVDHYQMMSGNVLRWRSRLPTDPAFDKTPLVTRDLTWKGAGTPYAVVVLPSPFWARAGAVARPRPQRGEMVPRASDSMTHSPIGSFGTSHSSPSTSGSSWTGGGGPFGGVGGW